MKATRFLIDGAVQGVGYRYFARRAALELGIRGFVRNLPDGTVEALAAGAAEAIRAFAERLRQGPRGSRVDSIESWEIESIEEVTGFEIRP